MLLQSVLRGGGGGLNAFYWSQIFALDPDVSFLDYWDIATTT